MPLFLEVTIEAAKYLVAGLSNATLTTLTWFMYLTIVSLWRLVLFATRWVNLI